jgi:hypothetical protein
VRDCILIQLDSNTGPAHFSDVQRKEVDEVERSLVVGFNGWFQRICVLFSSRNMSGGSTLGLMVGMQILDLDL